MRSSTGARLKYADTTERILGAFFEVYNRLGPGLAERVYQRALVDELRRRGCEVAPQQGLSMRYGRARASRFRPDLLVEGKVFVEIKARSRILKGHWAQLLNYLAVGGMEVGLLLNFGPRPQFKRLVLTATDCVGHGLIR